MAQAFDAIASDVEQLSEQIRNLERRVSALESQPANAAAAPSAAHSLALPKSRAPETWRGFPGPNVSTGALPVFGKAILGIAGAYLLRALAESGPIPRLPILLVAIVYAALWLVWAVRTHATNHFASVTYAITAALILSPLLWESTVRFQILWPPFTAAVLVAFPVLAWALAWRENLQAIPWVMTVAAVATALALIIATRDLWPFTVGLLALALLAEATVDLGHRLGIRAVPAIAADFAVWVLIYVMTSPEGVPSEYRPIGSTAITVLCLALLAIYGGSIGMRSFGLRQRLTIFEIAQAVVAFVLATFGTLRASPGSGPALGISFLLAALLCYWGALFRFMAPEQNLNRRVYASFAVALLLTGSLLVFPANFQAPFLCGAAVTASFLYMRTGKFSLGLHVSFYLTAAAILSGLLQLAVGALAGQVPPALDAGAGVVAVSAILCYAIGSHASTDQRKYRFLWIVPCVLVAGAAAALAVMASVRLGSSSGTLTAARLSVVRTMVTCSAALILGFTGARLKRAELVWVAYGAIAFGTLKLVFEDLRFGNTTSLMASLLSYGLILIVIPRLTLLGKNAS
ncbi:MAG: hypothetical protein WAM04_20750 [Candidatus Sulfotelmatobacter sp.]